MEDIGRMEDIGIIERILAHAANLGTSGIGIIDPCQVPVDDKFVNFCKEPRCPGYGSSMSCPPHVKGPDWFREYLTTFDRVLVFKFDVPTSVLLSEERHQVTRLIHETAAEIERFAMSNGYKKAHGFAAGSCKQVFCSQYLKCRVLAEGGPCRNPDQARQSMSGLGVDFQKLTSILGWKMETITSSTDFHEIPLGMMVGMVLVGDLISEV
jgi:predicted metal-binding protein